MFKTFIRLFEKKPANFPLRHGRTSKALLGTAVALSMAAALVLTGCGESDSPVEGTTSSGSEAAAEQITIPDAQEIAERLVKETANIQSADQDSSVRFSMTISIDGETAEMSADMRSNSSMTLDPQVAHMNMIMDLKTITPDTAGTSSESAADGSTQAADQDQASPEKLEMEMYTEMTDQNRYVVYSRDLPDGEWTALEMDLPEGAGVTDIFDVDLLNSIASGETAASVAPSTEVIDGKTCYVIDTALNDAQAMQALNNVTSIMSQMDMPMTNFPEDMLKDVQVPTRMWIDVETGLPVKIEQDMAELGNKLFQTMFDSLFSSQMEMAGVDATAAAAAMPEVQISFDEYIAEIIYKDYNSVNEIVIPEEIKNTERTQLNTTP